MEKNTKEHLFVCEIHIRSEEHTSELQSLCCISYVFVFLVMACACYVIILQRILYWFVREKADDSPVSDLLPANLHLLYHL